MPESTVAFAEPLLSEAPASRSSGSSGKKILALLALIGSGVAVVVNLSTVNMSSYARGGVGQRPINMAALGYSPPQGKSRQFLQPSMAGHAFQAWQLMGTGRTRKPLVEPARARYGKESLGPGKGMTGDIGDSFQAWGDLATLGTAGTVVAPETPAWLTYEQTDGVEYNPDAAVGADGASGGTPGVPGKGIITNWLTEKGFGFIKPDDGGDDIYAHISQLVEGLESVRKGDEVVYIKEMNERRGKEQAVQVGLAPDGKRGSDTDDGPGGTREIGTLVRWNSEKGYGFVKPKEGDDLFCHVTSLKGGEGSVKQGDEVAYFKNFDNKRQKFRAMDVRVATEEDKKEAEAAAAATAEAPAAEADAAEEAPSEEAVPEVPAEATEENVAPEPVPVSS